LKRDPGKPGKTLLSTDIQSQILEGALALGLELDDMCSSRLEGYCLLLQKWSRTMRLVGNSATDSLVLHILDSLAATRLPLPEVPLVDIGSGAGFPGLPLAVLNPDRQVILVESRLRRAAFLKEAVREMKLKNVRVYPERFEEVDVPLGALALARAVAPPERLLKMVEERRLRKAVLMISDSMLQEQYSPSWRVEAEDRPPLPFSPSHVNLLCSMN